VLELFDREWSLLSVWATAGMLPGGQVEVVRSEDRRDEGLYVAVLSIGGGLLEARLHVDAATLLPSSLSWESLRGTERLDLAEYDDPLGFMVPHVVTHWVGDMAIARQRVVSVAPAVSGVRFSMPESRPRDAAFAGKSRVEVTRARTGHFLVRPEVDGADLGWFVFDSGASSSVISSRAARRLDLRRLGTVPVVSVFGRQEQPAGRARSLALGPLTISAPFFVEMDTSPIEQAFGAEIGGILGYDVFSRAVVEVEAAVPAISLHDPDSYELRGGAWQPLTLHYQTPAVGAAFDGHEGLFRLDLGASGSPAGNVTFHAPAVEWLGLLSERDVERTAVGEQQVAFGRIGWFELAGRRFENPDAMFALGKGGVFDDPYLDGNVGLSFLAPFRVVFDYQRRRIAFAGRED
jgi:hypothetical protein